MNLEIEIRSTNPDDEIRSMNPDDEIRRMNMNDGMRRKNMNDGMRRMNLDDGLRSPIFQKIPGTTVSYLEQIRQKWAYEISIRFTSCCLHERIEKTTSQANKLKSLFLQNNTENGIPLQAHHGGTRIGSELIRFF